MTMHHRNLFVPPDHVVELGAAYERIDELADVLTRARDYLIQFYPHSEAAHYCLDAIDHALEAHRVQA
jgi:hypothetical protein